MKEITLLLPRLMIKYLKFLALPRLIRQKCKVILKNFSGERKGKTFRDEIFELCNLVIKSAEMPVWKLFSAWKRNLEILIKFSSLKITKSEEKAKWISSQFIF